MEKKYDLRERLIQFACRVIDVTEALPRTLAGYHLFQANLCEAVPRLPCTMAKHRQPKALLNLCTRGKFV